MATNFDLLKGDLVPKLKITHREDQETLAGLASFGDIVNIFTEKVGGVLRLFADIDSVPLRVAEWIRDKRFAERSIELMWRVMIDEKLFEKVITAVALLGHEIPAVAGMSPIELKKEDNELDTKELVGLTFSLDEDEEAFQIVNEGNKSNNKSDEGGDTMEIKDVLAKIASIEDQIASFVKAQKDKENTLLKTEAADAKKKIEGEIAGFKKQVKDLEGFKADYEKMKDSFEKKEKEHNDLVKKNRETEVKAFISDLKTQGKLLPAFEAEAFSLLIGLDTEAKIGKFSVIDEKDKSVETELSSFEAFKNLLKKLPKLVDFKETSKNSKGDEIVEETEVKIGDDTFQLSNVELDAKANEYMKESKCTYEEAIIKVSAKFKKENKAQGLEETDE